MRLQPRIMKGMTCALDEFTAKPHTFRDTPPNMPHNSAHAHMHARMHARMHWSHPWVRYLMVAPL